MFSMIAVLTALAVLTLAVEAQHTYSHGTYNDNHNLARPFEASPPLVTVAAAPIYAAQAPSVYASPIFTKVAIPTIVKPTASSASIYINAPPSPIHSAPIGYAAAAPSVTTHFSVPASTSSVYAGTANDKVATVAYAAPVAAHQEEYADPKYEYAYGVEDHHTGDIHSQKEQRDGDHVVGEYSLHEPDGTVRIVKYYDDGHGFNAIVEKQGTPSAANAAVPVPVALNKVVIPVTESHY